MRSVGLTFPVCSPEPIEHVTAQWTVSNLRVVEVLGRVGIQRGERCSVAFMPLPQLQPGRRRFGSDTIVTIVPEMPLEKPWRVDTGRMNQETAHPVCSTCGLRAEDESAARLTWVLGVEKGRRVWTCDRCSREHLRSIEGKIDSAWWW